MPDPDLPNIADELALEALGGGAFVGVSDRREGRVFGGLLVAQSLRAAQLTVEPGRAAHSLHGVFVRAGRAGAPLRYDVESTHDGGSFSTRRVVATQDGAVAFLLTARFQADEEGPEYQVEPAPVGPRPETLPVGRYDSPWFESRDVDADEPGQPTHARVAWFRARSPLPDDTELHRHALAFLSDHGPTRAVREPHVNSVDTERRMSVSLDHSVWFHRPARVDEWLRYSLTPMATVGGRGLALGSIRTAVGELVATVAQEAMLRILPSAEMS